MQSRREIDLDAESLAMGARLERRPGALPNRAPSLDPADLLLPIEARIALKRLRQAAADLNATANAASRRRVRALDPLYAARTTAENLRRQKPAAHPDDLAIAAAELKHREEEFAQLDQYAEAATEAWRALGGAVSRCQRYLESLPGGAEITMASPPKLAKIADIPAAIEKARQRRATLLADRAAIEAAPLPSQVVRARARAEIEALAARGAPYLGDMFEGAGGMRWPRPDRFHGACGVAVMPDGGTGGVTVMGAQTQVDALAVLAWLNKDAIIRRLETEIAELADDGRALSHEQRTAKLEETDAKILAAEREEVALIAAAGGAVAYRPDTDPRALLSIIGPAPELN